MGPSFLYEISCTKLTNSFPPTSHVYFEVLNILNSKYYYLNTAVIYLTNSYGSTLRTDIADI